MRTQFHGHNPDRIRAHQMFDVVVLPIDIPTLALSRGLMEMMFGGLLLYLGRRDEVADGARFWAIGFFLNGISLFVFPLQIPESWEQARTVVNHITLGTSSVFFLLGFWAFGRQSRQPWLAILVLAIPLASLLAWEVLWPNARLRVLCTASGQALFLVALQFSLRRAPRGELAQIYRRIRYVVFAYLLVFVWSYASIANVLPTSAHLAVGYHRTLFSVSSLLFMLSLAVGCLALQFAWLAAHNADLAMIDWQTGLLNRRGFFQAAARNAQLRDDRETPASVIALDIDHFKRINDDHGHAAGDRVLEALGKCLRELTEPGHLIARMGGEEFCVVLPKTRQRVASALAETVRACCRETPVTTEDGRSIDFTVSAGVCETGLRQPLEQALAKADEALYFAKRNGRDQVVLGASIAEPV